MPVALLDPTLHVVILGYLGAWAGGHYHIQLSPDVYAIDTTNGQLLARIPVGHGPHGLSVYPQPGRYSLGHTGVFR